MFVTSPLDLSIFPSLLLGTTLFRLVLNVASTRLILTAGDRATTADAAAFAAGNVIHAFSTFVTGGGTGAQQQMVVGIIIFIILIIIQFVVITKGATRISEVAARFTLDAMPGKQMAIDADLNAGIIKEDEANAAARDIAREAEFYGAMDGASKFVRGDAVAGIIIVFINVIGGVAIGKFQYGWDLHRVPRDLHQAHHRRRHRLAGPRPHHQLGRRLARHPQQLQGKPRRRIHPAVHRARRISLVRRGGIPRPDELHRHARDAALGAGDLPRRHRLGDDAEQKQSRRRRRRQQGKSRRRSRQKKPEKIETLLAVDAMELEVGYQLVQLVDTTKGGDLLERISLIRRQIAIEFGVVVPPIRIRDNMQLDPHAYVIKLRGNPLASGTRLSRPIPRDGFRRRLRRIGGIETKEPAFGLPAWWIPRASGRRPR